MQKPQKGILCAGCPHRAAYTVVKEALRSVRSRVVCGDAGCSRVGTVHPAAACCPGGHEQLPERLNQPIPYNQQSAFDACVRFIPGAHVKTPEGLQDLLRSQHAARSVIFALTASEAPMLEREEIEDLACVLQEHGIDSVAVLDPFDTTVCLETLHQALETPGAHAVIFLSPCAQLLSGSQLPAPVEVDRYMCVGCHRCGQLTACPALHFAPPTYEVDPQICAGCDLCCSFCRTQSIYSPRSKQDHAQRARERMSIALQHLRRA